MGTYDELAKLDKSPPTPGSNARSRNQQNRKPSQSANRPTNRPTNQPADQSTDPPISWPIKVEGLGPVVGKSKSFYITQKVDSWLDDAVRYLKSRDLHKVDRSVVVNAMLHSPDLFEPSNLDKMRERLLAHLTNKSLSRTQSANQPASRSADRSTDQSTS